MFWLEAATHGEVVGEVVLSLLLGVAPALVLGVTPAKHYRCAWVAEQIRVSHDKKIKK